MSPTQRPLRENTQHSQKADVHIPGGIQSLNTSKRSAADPLLRPRTTGIGVCNPYTYILGRTGDTLSSQTLRRDLIVKNPL
jgi:hypothetical protein